MRLAWGDTHGYSRAKTLTVPAFVSALTERLQYRRRHHDARFRRRPRLCLVHARRRHGARRDDGLAQSHRRRRSLRHSASCPGRPARAGFSATNISTTAGRFISRRANCCARRCKSSTARGYASVIGAEIEWYLLRVADDHLSDDNIGAPGTRGRPIRTWPAEPGYHYHSESNMDLDAAGVSMRSATPSKRSGSGCARSRTNGAPDRSSAPSRRARRWRPPTTCSCSAPRRGRSAAASAISPPSWPAGAEGLLRQRLAPASVADRRGERRKNLFMPEKPGEVLSPLGQSYLAGLLQYAVPATVFATPTVNGYRRFRANSLAPDRAGWGYDNRGAMIRVLGGAGRSGDAAGKPQRRARGQSLSLHPVAGRHRPCRHRSRACNRRRPTTRPTRPSGRCCRKACPKRSTRSTRSRCSARALGDTFVDYFVRLKRTELARYQQLA